MYECMYEGQGVGGKNICHFFKMFVKSSFANFSVHFVFNVQYIFMFFSQMNTNFIIYINIATVCLFNCLFHPYHLNLLSRGHNNANKM